VVAPGIETLLEGQKQAASELPASLFDDARRLHKSRHDALLKRSGGGENPYLIHQELGEVMTKAATVVRRNDQLEAALSTVSDLYERAKKCSLSDTGNWTNQNVVFTKALLDMFPLALTILKGALQRDECRGAHFKPAFAFGSLTASDPAERRREAEAWCDRFDANNERWLKSTIAQWTGDEVEITYEDVDTSLITPRPRLYGLVGAEDIEKVWKERQAAKDASQNGNGAQTAGKLTAATR
jgi:succinate dehydrogenase / fumarate reductase flavoprotein subunit